MASSACRATEDPHPHERPTRSDVLVLDGEEARLVLATADESKCGIEDAVALILRRAASAV